MTKKKKVTLVDEIAAVRERADEALDRLAEEMRPPNVPGPVLRQMWLARANGNMIDAFEIAAKENTHEKNF